VRRLLGRPPRTTAPATWSARPCVTGGNSPRRLPGRAGTAGTDACKRAAPRGRQRSDRPRTGRLVLDLGPCSRSGPYRPAASTTVVEAARGPTRENSYEQPDPTARRRSTLDKRSAPAERPILAATRAHQSDGASPKTRSPPTPSTSQRRPTPSMDVGRRTLPSDRKALHLSCSAPPGWDTGSADEAPLRAV
jgi:hypothetical protein